MTGLLFLIICILAAVSIGTGLAYLIAWIDCKRAEKENYKKQLTNGK